MTADMWIDVFLALALLVYTLMCMWTVHKKSNAPCLQIGSMDQLGGISVLAVTRSKLPCLLRSVVVVVLIWRVVVLLLAIGATMPSVAVLSALWAVTAIYHLWLARILTESVREATRMGFGRK